MIHLVLKNHLSHIQKSPCHNRHNQQHHPQLQKHPRPQSRTPTNLLSRSDPPCLSIPTTERFPPRILEERAGRPLNRGRWLILNEGRGGGLRTVFCCPRSPIGPCRLFRMRVG
jgi:hypothetical protein